MNDTIMTTAGATGTAILSDVLSARTNEEIPTVWIAIEKLHESPANPRKHFPAGPLQDLAKSMTTDGFRFWRPIVARPHPVIPEDYEIGAGHRRYRAARLAGLTQAPVQVIEMTEEAFQHLLHFDNSGGEEVHPIDEGAGWALLREQTGISVQSIADHAGKSKETVYKRLLLSKLIPEAKEAVLDNRISVRHAELIAPYSQPDQLFALKACEPPSWDLDKIVTTRDLQAWIAKNLQLDLSQAPFSTVDSELLPEAGSCLDCPHRVGNRPDFDPANDIAQMCSLPDCYSKKVAAHVSVEKLRLIKQFGYLVLVSDHGRTALDGVTPTEEWHEVPLLTDDPAAKSALVVEGRRIGKVIRVVIQERLNLTTPPAAAPKKAAPLRPDSGLSKSERDKQNADAQKEQARCQRELDAQARQRKEAEANLAKEKHARLAVLSAILAKAAWPPTRESICELLPDFLNNIIDDLDPVLAECGVPNPMSANRVHLMELSDDNLARLCLIALLQGDFEGFNLGRKSAQLDALAKRYAIDEGRVRTRAAHQYVIDACEIDFGKDLIECISESKKNKNPLADIKFTAKPGGVWFVRYCVSLPVKAGEGYGESGPVTNPADAAAEFNARAIWKDRGAAMDEAFARILKIAAKVSTYGPAMEATRSAAEEVSRWVKAGQAARAAMAALEEKPKGVKDVIGKLPVMGASEAGKKKAAAVPPAKAAIKKAAKAPAAKPAKKAAKK